MSVFRIENKDEGPVLVYLYGNIGYDWWRDDDENTAKGFSQTLDELGGRAIELHIDSCGGDVYEAFGIASALQRYDGEIDVYIDGVAASAASYIAVMGDRVHIADFAQFMIHDAWCCASGNARDFASIIERLEAIDETIASIIAKRCGMEIDDVMAAMDKETWYSAKEAVEAGLADEVIEVEQRMAACIDANLLGKYQNTPDFLLKQASPVDDEAGEVVETASEQVDENATDDAKVPASEVDVVDDPGKSHTANKVDEPRERLMVLDGRVFRFKE